MTKLERKLQARKWVDSMEEKHPDKIANSITKSRIYFPDELQHNIEETNKQFNTIISIVDLTTVQAIFDYRKKYSDLKIAALNFASYKHPGGGFILGMNAQEESLCHCSTLYNVLREFESTFYGKHFKILNRGLYNDDILYTPDIYFETATECEGIYCDIINCAAPNLGAARRNQVQINKVSEAFEKRILSVLSCAKENRIDVLILGAFGCGVFKNDPYMVANLFKQAICTYFCDSFKHVIFAIPDEYSTNYVAFKHIF